MWVVVLRSTVTTTGELTNMEPVYLVPGQNQLVRYPFPTSMSRTLTLLTPPQAVMLQRVSIIKASLDVKIMGSLLLACLDSGEAAPDLIKKACAQPALLCNVCLDLSGVAFEGLANTSKTSSALTAQRVNHILFATGLLLMKHCKSLIIQVAGIKQSPG